MRFYNRIYQKLLFAGFLLVCLMLSSTIKAQEQKEKKTRQMVDVTLKVVDETGTPIPKASVVVGEGIIHTQTDEAGSVSFRGYPDDFVTITSKAYEKNVVFVVDLTKGSSVTLIKSKLFMTSEDNVSLPFTTMKKRTTTGSTFVLKGDQLDRYPSTDLRNALTGQGGLDVREMVGSPGINAQEYLGSFYAIEKVSVGAHGRSMSYMVDNVLTDITELPLDPNEIESVSIIKDIVGKSMFGPAASEGIIYIKTKRGSKNEHTLNMNVEQGVGTIDRMPGYVSGADYARLNNLARTNDGLAPLYTDYDIAQYEKNDPYDKVYPSINFRELMLKNTRSFTRANLSSSGGNDIIQYFAYVGYNGEGDIYKIGAPANYSRVNTRSNIDIQVNDKFKIGFDFYGNIGIRKSPNYGYSSNFTSENSSSNPVLGLTEFPDVLTHITTIPPIAFPIWASYNEASKTPWYGVTTAYPINPIGNIEGNGYYTDGGRQGLANVNLDYDLSGVLKGLKSKTFLGFSTYNMVRIGKAEDYIAYIAKPTVSATTGNDTLPVTLTKAHNGVDQASQAKLMDYYFQRYVIFENLSYEKQFGKNFIQTSFTYYLSKAFLNDVEEPQRQQNGILTGLYTFDDKISLMGVLNYSGTSSFDKNNRYAMFPSVGASYVISEESFLKGLKFIDYLKLRAEYGTLGVENFMSPYRYKDNWSYNSSGSAFGAQGSNQWFGSSTDANVQRAYPNRIGNADLTWEKSKEISAGFDALLFNGKVNFELTYYNTLRIGSIVQLQNALPYALGLSGSRPYTNYNDTRFYGVESILHLSDKIGEFSYSIGGSATIQNSERVKYDEPAYRFDYQYRVGLPADAIFGQKYLGKFESDAEALVVPQLYDAVLKTGDLKYADNNNDGVVDDNDATMIGHGTPRLFYALDATLRYKNFEVTVLGTGRAFYDLSIASPYTQNGWGDNTYSNFVKDNIGGKYPRLTYYRVNNNFVGSDFWLVDGGFFKIQNVEIAYNLPSSVTNIIGSRGIRIYARGANLMTISKVKGVDPESIIAGVMNYPLYRTITGGVKLIF